MPAPSHLTETDLELVLYARRIGPSGLSGHTIRQAWARHLLPVVHAHIADGSAALADAMREHGLGEDLLPRTSIVDFAVRLCQLGYRPEVTPPTSSADDPAIAAAFADVTRTLPQLRRTITDHEQRHAYFADLLARHNVHAHPDEVDTVGLHDRLTRALTLSDPDWTLVAAHDSMHCPGWHPSASHRTTLLYRHPDQGWAALAWIREWQPRMAPPVDLVACQRYDAAELLHDLALTAHNQVEFNASWVPLFSPDLFGDDVFARASGLLALADAPNRLTGVTGCPHPHDNHPMPPSTPQES